jgi:DNA-binding transcriptional LysR family regulator
MRFDIQTLKAFLAIAEEGSIAAAAAREHTVASAISKRVAEMEAHCGTGLLYRHRRGVSLTPAGAELVAHARRVIDELNRLDSALSDYASGVRGQVRLLANTSAIVQFLPADLAAFLKKHPTVKIDLEERTSDHIQKTVLDGLADIGIMVANRPLEGLNARPYRSDRLVVMMPPGHPLSRRKRIRFADTLAFDHVGLPRGTSLCETFLDEAGKLDKPLKLRIQATSFEGLVLMVSAGLGIGVLPEGSVVPFLEARRVVARPLAEPWAIRQLLVVTGEGRPMTRVARLLAEHLSAD